MLTFIPKDPKHHSQLLVRVGMYGNQEMKEKVQWLQEPTSGSCIGKVLGTWCSPNIGFFAGKEVSQKQYYILRGLAEVCPTFKRPKGLCPHRISI